MRRVVQRRRQRGGHFELDLDRTSALAGHLLDHQNSSGHQAGVARVLSAGTFKLGLVAAVKPEDTTVYVRNATGMKAGDTVTIGSGADAEAHKITSAGTAAADRTTVWQPLPDGPVLTVPAGSDNLPVTSTAGLEAGQKVVLGYGAKHPRFPATQSSSKW